MKFGLKNTTIKQIIKVFSSFSQVEEAIIFGSRAKGNYKPASDIDITLKGDELTLRDLNKISMALYEILSPYTIDLSIYKQIDNPELIEHINRVGKLFYSRKGLETF
jgi:predicted nucleotidyltransferase